MAYLPIVSLSRLCLLPVVLACACWAPDVTAPLCPLPTVSQVEQILDVRRRLALDLLVVIDNSSRMAAKQQALVTALSGLLPSLERFDYHIGVVTTDVGSWAAPDAPWSMPFPACDSFVGDDGQLQNTSCLDRSNVSADAARTCRTLCPGRQFLPAEGARFISNYSGIKNVPAVVEIDPRTGNAIDHGPEYAFRCMALVGDSGCGLASPLAAMQRALDGHRADNSGFLRPNSVLAVIVLTDQDDCSVQLDKRSENDPRTRDCAAPDAAAPYDCYNPQFRCLARGLVCDQPLNSAGKKTGCRERPESYLEPVDHYVRFLQTLRPASKLRFLGVWPLPALADGIPLVVEQTISGGSAGLVAGTGSQAACAESGDPSFFGLAQVRLSHLAKALAPPDLPSMEASICSPSQYADALHPAFNPPLQCKAWLPCFPGQPQIQRDGSPACVVGDVPEDSPESAPAHPLPACAASCCAAISSSYGCGDTWPDQTAMACKDEPADCFCATKSPTDSCLDGVALGVWRKGNVRPPPDKVVSFRCATTDNVCPLQH